MRSPFQSKRLSLLRPIHGPLGCSPAMCKAFPQGISPTVICTLSLVDRQNSSGYCFVPQKASHFSPPLHCCSTPHVHPLISWTKVSKRSTWWIDLPALVEMSQLTWCGTDIHSSHQAKLQNCEKINNYCCFKLLDLGIVCNAAVNETSLETLTTQ